MTAGPMLGRRPVIYNPTNPRFIPTLSLKWLGVVMVGILLGFLGFPFLMPLGQQVNFSRFGEARVRVGIYARVSSYDDDQDPENQLLKLREYALQRGWTVYSEHKDHASGAAPSRPQLEHLLNEARGRHIDVLLVVRIDRLARSTLQLLHMLEELRHYGVELVCTDQEIDTSSPMGKMVVTVLGAVAELELELIRERTKDGLARARAQGKRLGRPPCENKDDEIALLRSQGLSMREIGLRVGLSHQAVKQRLRRSRVQKREQSER
jgi:DNA invertase Pin-like site-specific DNA recombinase